MSLAMISAEHWYAVFARPGDPVPATLPLVAWIVQQDEPMDAGMTLFPPDAKGYLTCAVSKDAHNKVQAAEASEDFPHSSRSIITYWELHTPSQVAEETGWIIAGYSQRRE